MVVALANGVGLALSTMVMEPVITNSVQNAIHPAVAPSLDQPALEPSAPNRCMRRRQIVEVVVVAESVVTTPASGLRHTGHDSLGSNCSVM
jgi:hypothetical protein